MELSTGQLGFFDVQKDALQIGNLPGVLGIGVNPHPFRHHPAEGNVGEAADFDEGPLFGDLPLDRGPPARRQACPVRPPQGAKRPEHRAGDHDEKQGTQVPGEMQVIHDEPRET